MAIVPNIVPNIPQVAFPPKSRSNSTRGRPGAPPAPGKKGKGARECPVPAAPLRTLLSGPKPLKAGPGRARAASRASILIGVGGRTGQREKPGGEGGWCEGSARERSGLGERSRAQSRRRRRRFAPHSRPGRPTGSGSGTGSVPSARGSPGLGGGSEEEAAEAEVNAGGK